VRQPLDVVLEVLRIENGEVAELTMFVSTELFPAFALPEGI
jgi:hypothetical protein